MFYNLFIIEISNYLYWYFVIVSFIGISCESGVRTSLAIKPPVLLHSATPSRRAERIRIPEKILQRATLFVGCSSIPKV